MRDRGEEEGEKGGRLERERRFITSYFILLLDTSNLLFGLIADASTLDSFAVYSHLKDDTARWLRR